MGKIITIFEKGNITDKFVLGINLAFELADELKNKTILIDLSFCGENVSELINGFKPHKTIYDIAKNISVLDETIIKGYIPEHSQNLSLIEGVSSNKKTLMQPEVILKILEIISSAYSHVIIVAPDEYDNYLLSILSVSNLIFLNMAPHTLSLNQSRIFLDKIKDWNFSLNTIKPIISAVDKKITFDNSKIEELIGLKIFFTVYYDNEVKTLSINSGSPAVVSVPHSIFALNIKQLAKKLFLENSTNNSIHKCLNKVSELGQEQNFTQKDSKELKNKIRKEILHELNIKNIDLKQLSDLSKTAEIREIAKTSIQDILLKENVDISRDERSRFVNEILDDILGLGCIESLLKDHEITEIMINGTKNIYIEKQGKIELTDLKFDSDEQLLVTIERIVAPIGRRIDESSPLVDARLNDGSRVNAIIPPLALDGPCLTIRKFSNKKLLIDDLIALDALSAEMAEFLKICVQLRKNIIISGGTGSGKTTLLNVISSFIPKSERIVTIEDSAELRLPQEHIVRLETRPPSIEGSGEITIRRLVINALRMRPDRIVVGECRGGEALDMLQAMNTGHDGSMTTIHANTPKDAISRITTMVIMAGADLPEKAIREQIYSAVQIIVQLSRLADGSRKITEIAEVVGVNCDSINIIPLFKYEQTSMSNNKVIGNFITTEYRSSFMNKVKTHGLNFNVFK